MVLPAAADFGFGEPVGGGWLFVVVGAVGGGFGGGVPPVFDFGDGGWGWRDRGWLFVEDFFFGFFDNEFGLFDRGWFGARLFYGGGLGDGGWGLGWEFDCGDDWFGHGFGQQFRLRRFR